MFKYPLVRITKFSDMHVHCPVCNLRYEVEPGFFIGAMYVSYLMSLILFGTVSVSIYMLAEDPGFIVYILAIPGTVLLLLPLIFRYSRAIFLHWFGGVKYNHKYD